MSDLGLSKKLKGSKTIGVVNSIVGSNGEIIKMVSPNTLMHFNNTPGFPFKIHEGIKRENLKRSIIENGIITPFIVRQLPEQYKNIKPEYEYEILAGNNRNSIAIEIGLEFVPVIVKNVDDETAVKYMNEENFHQRGEILPSERAFALRMQLDAAKCQGKRTDLNINELEDNISSSGTQVAGRDKVAEDNSTSASQVRRYVRLTYLTRGLLDAVDNKLLGFRAAVEISYLSSDSQKIIESLIKNQSTNISEKQSLQLRELEKELGTLSLNDILLVLSEKKIKHNSKISIPYKIIKEFFDDEDDEGAIINRIISLLKSEKGDYPNID